MYTFNKHLTVEANIAVAHGVAFFAAHEKGLIGATGSLACKTSGKKGTIVVHATIVNDVRMVSIVCNGVDAMHRSAVDAIVHLIQLAGVKNATRAIESACRDRSDGGNNLHTIEAVFAQTDSALFSKTFFRSSAHPNGRWCYSVRLGYTEQTRCYGGGCCTYATYAEGLVGWNRANAKAS